MRIGMVCPYSISVPGGVQEQVLGLARSLRAKGHPTRILAPSDGPPPDGFVTPLGNSIPTAANGSVAPIAPDPSAQLRLIRAVRDEGFDVLHLHEPMVPGACMTAALLKPAPLVGTFHAAGTSASYEYLSPALRWLAGRLDVRVVVSAEAQALAEEHIGGTYEHLFNGIEIDRFAHAEPWPVEGRTIFFLGRHEPRKGLDVLLAALPMLPADITVWIGSDGPDTERLRVRHAGDPRIHWLGRLSDEDKRRRLKAADIFCAPSLRGESFGVVLLEAMAAGAAIVASDLSGYRLVARPDQDGLLVPPGDAEALAAALNRVLGDPALRTSLVETATTRARSFSMDQLADHYLRLYEQVCTPAPQPRGWLRSRSGARKP
ncbi:glycosyltransferase family 4 protein [Aquihabitans daechungensis]|uniref:glycosyltransferase family 4 protein n=1 Tax=Aquihabitans daechungensis TaxID=1052257 RepID=UPI003BA35341